jgi:CDP-diglyceride synthetase
MVNSVLQIYVSLAPVIIAGVLNMVWCSTSLAPGLNRPLDNHAVLRDGRRLFGDNKTWKGLLGMLVLGSLAFVLWSLVVQGSSLDQWDLFHQRHAATLPFDALVGVLLGAAYALCELPNSFLKRRLDIAPGKESAGPQRWLLVVLDQIDSVVGCAVVVALLATVTPLFLLGLVVVGGITHILLNMALFAAGLRRNRF